jgi:hypothetical protein
MERREGEQNPQQRTRSKDNSLQGREKERIRRMTVNIFKNHYKRFKDGEFRSVDLYKGDFKPLPTTTTTDSSEPLRVLLPSDFFLPMEYEELFTPFIKVFRKDLDDIDPEFGGYREVPPPKTKALEKFVKENPGKQLAYSYMSFPLKSDSFEERRIEVKRYYDNLLLHRPIAEIWTAVSIPKL